MSNDIHKTADASLARLIDLGAEPGGFGEAELGRMLLHQLAAPLLFDMQLQSRQLSQALTTYTATGQPAPERFGELLFSPRPPVELLELTKQFAKSNRAHPDLPMQKIAGVLYYAAILVAQMRCGRSISQLSDADLKKGVTWVLDQPWVDERTRALFDEGIRNRAIVE